MHDSTQVNMCGTDQKVAFDAVELEDCLKLQEDCVGLSDGCKKLLQGKCRCTVILLCSQRLYAKHRQCDKTD